MIGFGGGDSVDAMCCARGTTTESSNTADKAACGNFLQAESVKFATLDQSIPNACPMDRRGDLKRCGFGDLRPELLCEPVYVVGEDRRFVAGAGNRHVAETGIEQVGMNAGISVNQDTLSGKSLGAVARDSVERTWWLREAQERIAESRIDQNARVEDDLKIGTHSPGNNTLSYRPRSSASFAI